MWQKVTSATSLIVMNRDLQNANLAAMILSVSVRLIENRLTIFSVKTVNIPSLVKVVTELD